MAEQLLQKKYAKMKIDKDLKGAISELVSLVSSKVLQKFREKPSKPLKTRDMNELILKNLAKLDPADVELNLRRAKLREAKRAKKELEAKLVHIKESIENFSAIDELTKVKPTLQDSQIRQEYYEEQKLKAKEVQKKTQEYRQQQKKRQAKIEKYISNLEQQIENDKVKKQMQIEEISHKKKKDYEKYLQKIHEKARARKKDLQESKVYSQCFQKADKPLYIKVSEKFWKDIEMPELEKRKADLQRKRILNSYSSQQILDHAKWYETVRQEHKKKYEKELQSVSMDRKIKSTENNFTIWQQKIKNEEKNLKEEKNKEFEEIMKKLEKRSQYSSLVRQMYPPSVDSAKSKEVEMRKLKFAASVNLIKKELPESIPEKTDWKPHKFKPNKMAPKKQEARKTPEYVDYLKKMREEKFKDMEEKNQDEKEEVKDLKINFEQLENLSDEKKVKILKKKAKMIENELRKKENKFSKTPINLAETDDINEMLISSIKAKLAIIEKTKE